MAEAPTILAFAGSARRESYNKKLLAAAVAGAEAAGARVTPLDLRDHPLPLYDGDLEAESGLPEKAVELRGLFRSHRGLLIASPEYNSSLTPLLKNTLDWVSRSPEGGGDLSGFRGKVVALCGASPGPLGAMRSVTHLRALLSNIGCTVLARQVTLRGASDAFDDDGRLRDARQQQRAEALGAELADWLRRLHAS